MRWACVYRYLSVVQQSRMYGKMSGSKFERLPDSVIPKHYKLFLRPDLKNLVFSGIVSIDIDVKANCSKIVLNSVDLDIKSAKFKNDTQNIEWKNRDQIILSSEQGTLSLISDCSIPVGSGQLTIEFSGKITDLMKGLYNSKYISASGEERNSAVTQFEPTDARRCFPCWDEPALKATFKISVSAPKGLVCLSNMPEEREEPDGDHRIIHFAKTPIMSTYLVALVVGEYDYVEDMSKDGVRVRVYTPVGKAEQGKFALDVTTKVLPYYKDYFNIAYPLPKIDLITVANFSAGAMENWGLVTYRETCLLVDPANTSAASKQWVALVVGHELAHQWFGNLVTMEWWTHLWLNEGYASFVEFLCVAHLFPEYDIWTQFVTGTYCTALELDGLKNSHPIEVPVGHPSEIDEIFDDISYCKGASVIRMLHRYIGDQDFRKGMNLYLTKHAYGNTFTEDLWAALEEASGKPVGAVMSTWTKQRGYPLLKVGLQDNTLTVKQQRFSATGSPDEPALWMVPLSVATQSSRGKEVLSTVLETESAEFKLPSAESGWVKLNPGTVDFYRTQYPEELLARFYPAIKDKSLPPLDRLGLLDDLFALVKAGLSDTVSVLRLFEAYRFDDNYTVWSTINSCVARLTILLSHTDLEILWRHHLSRLFIDIYNRLGWTPKPNESHLDKLLRSLVLGRLASCGETSVVEEARRRFNSHLVGSEIIPADLRSSVYRAIITHGGMESYEALLKLYRAVDLQEERERIGRSLGCSRDADVLAKVLEFSLSEEVRSQDTIFIIISVAYHSAVGRDLAWAFLQKHWTLLKERYSDGMLLPRLVKNLAENYACEEKAVEIETFFRSSPSPVCERTIQQSLETIRLNAAWLKRDLASIKQFLEKPSY